MSRKFKCSHPLSVHYVNAWQSILYYFPILGLRKLRLWAKETPTFLPPFSQKPATFLQVYRTVYTIVNLFHSLTDSKDYMVTTVSVTARNYFCPLFACLTEKSNGITKEFCTFAHEYGWYLWSTLTTRQTTLPASVVLGILQHLTVPSNLPSASHQRIIWAIWVGCLRKKENNDEDKI